MRHSFLLFALLSIGLTACQTKKTYQQNSGDIFHTTYHIQYAYHKDLHPEILSELKNFDASLSMFNPSSTLSRINQAGTEACDICQDAKVMHVLKKAAEITALTKGAFDMTVAPLVNLWGFGFQKKDNIKAADIDSIKNFVGFEKIRFEEGMVYKSDSRVQLDASAIAKGYACDVIADLLAGYGIRDYLVEIGGELRMAGHNAHKQIWRIGIDKPFDDSLALERTLHSILQLTDKGMASSGNYRNFYIQDGRKIAHTIDPRSGYPVQHSLLSATVIAKDCLTADALATAFMVMGKEEAIRLLEKLPAIEAYFIYADEDGLFQTWCSPSLTDKIIEAKAGVSK